MWGETEMALSVRTAGHDASTLRRAAFGVAALAAIAAVLIAIGLAIQLAPAATTSAPVAQGAVYDETQAHPAAMRVVGSDYDEATLPRGAQPAVGSDYDEAQLHPGAWSIDSAPARLPLDMSRGR